jgi:hypothetical protein
MTPIDPRDAGIFRNERPGEIERYIQDEWKGDRSVLYESGKRHRYCITMQFKHFRKIVIYIKRKFRKT